MGAWGTSLYANDTTSDIRGDYLDLLRRGKTNEEVTQKLMDDNREIFGDSEEEPLFWFALADTQWNYGRLLPEVKEKALYFIDHPEELERWKDSGEKRLNEWRRTREKLREKLLSPQPPEKKVSKYRLYQCKWKPGDVFAYRFSEECSKEPGFYGKYMVLRKVSEDTCWPGHIVPVVQVYKWIGKEIPTMDEVKHMKLLQIGYYPTALQFKPELKREYYFSLLSTSARVIPNERLTFLGNLAGDDLVTFTEDHPYELEGVGWDSQRCRNRLEAYIISMYTAWKDID